VHRRAEAVHDDAAALHERAAELADQHDAAMRAKGKR